MYIFGIMQIFGIMGMDFEKVVRSRERNQTIFYVEMINQSQNSG